MHSLLIVDDEPLERSTIKMLVERHCKGISVVGEAANGREAVEMTDRFKPDIVFMDIKMPGMSGLEAAAQIRDRHPETRIVIISAYDYFEYARDAVTLGADDYLLKPTLVEDIRRVLERASHSIEIENQRREYNASIRRQLRELRAFLEQQFIHALLDGRTETLLEETLSLLEIPFASGYAMAARVSSFPEYISGEARRHIYVKRLGEKLAEFLEEQGISAAEADVDGTVCIVVFNAAGQDEYANRLDSLVLSAKIKDYCQQKLQVALEIGIGDVYTRLSQLAASLVEARVALSRDRDDVVGSHFGDAAIHIRDAGYPFEAERNLCERISRGERAQKEILSLTGWMRECRISDADMRRKLFEIIVIATRSVALFGDIAAELLDTGAYYFEIEKLSGCDEAEEFLSRFAKSLAAVVVNLREENVGEQVAKAVEYINRNFEKSLTLEEVARVAALSPFYFSKLFKQQIGQNFIDYLTSHRMNLAQKLLREGKCSVKEISYQVGYSDPNYFSKLFKKFFGYSPTQNESAL